MWPADGWAEELHGLTAPRAHHDVDLLLRDTSLAALEEFLAVRAVQETAAKRSVPERAFELEGTVVELILVTAGPQHDPTTVFWGEQSYPLARRHVRGHRPGGRNEGGRPTTGVADRPEAPPRGTPTAPALLAEVALTPQARAARTCAPMLRPVSSESS